MYHADLLGGLAARLAGVKAVAWCIRNSNLDRDKTRRGTRWVVATCAHVRLAAYHRIKSSEQARAVHVALGYVAEKMAVTSTASISPALNRMLPRARDCVPSWGCPQIHRWSG